MKSRDVEAVQREENPVEERRSDELRKCHEERGSRCATRRIGEVPKAGMRFSNDLWLQLGVEKGMLAKAAGAEPNFRQYGEMKNCTPLWREVRDFEVNMYKSTPAPRPLLRSCDVRRSARSVVRAKHISVGKMRKTQQCSDRLICEVADGRKSALWSRSTFRSQNVQNTPDWDHFWKLR